MMEGIMKRMMPIPSVTVGPGPCKKNSDMAFVTG
jgi:hypothetical protein